MGPLPVKRALTQWFNSLFVSHLIIENTLNVTSHDFLRVLQSSRAVCFFAIMTKSVVSISIQCVSFMYF